MERQTVLIVDDSELNRMMLMEILGEQYHYIEAQNGREAVRLMENRYRPYPAGYGHAGDERLSGAGADEPLPVDR